MNLDDVTTYLDGPTSHQLAILKALQGKHVYMGTVSAKVKKQRRARGKVAKASRRINRGS